MSNRQRGGRRRACFDFTDGDSDVIPDTPPFPPAAPSTQEVVHLLEGLQDEPAEMSMSDSLCMSPVLNDAQIFYSSKNSDSGLF